MKVSYVIKRGFENRVDFERKEELVMLERDSNSASCCCQLCQDTCGSQPSSAQKSQTGVMPQNSGCKTEWVLLS